MNSILAVTVVFLVFTSNAFAQTPKQIDYFKVTVTDVTEKYRIVSAPSPSPTPTPTPTLTPTSNQTSNPNGSLGQRILSQVQLSDIITIGQKIWDFIISGKPSADYKVMKASVVPEGITSWTQLSGWSRPVSKVYHVEFKDIFGGVAGGFDYRITFIYGGNYNGKGKFIGEISFVPANIKLHTDRSIVVKAEILDTFNFGSVLDPVAAAQLQITWSSSTTLHYDMKSVEYVLYGNGEIQDLTHGTFEQL